MLDLLVIGGGAAGFYGAIHAAMRFPQAKIMILEQNREFLAKVKISGGGRCNLTHRPMPPELLVKHYPRGERELLGPFSQHASKDTMSFFEALGVTLKVESDGRVFPLSDNSQTIIDSLLHRAKGLGIQLQTGIKVTGFTPLADGGVTWRVTTAAGEFHTKTLLVCPGSSSGIWKILSSLGHEIISPVPSLFTFRISDPRLSGLQGISANAQITLSVNNPPDKNIGVSQGKKQKKRLLSETGPVLITHWGLSGPAVLRLSAWGARHLAQLDYRFNVKVNWLPNRSADQVYDALLAVRNKESAKWVCNSRFEDLPTRLWKQLVSAAKIGTEMRWADLSKRQLEQLKEQISACEFEVTGKSTFKDEFVTAGGVSLKEVHFKTFESKKLPGLFFAGEVLDIDAITGGFNFQNAWTGGYLAATGIAQRLKNQVNPK